MKKIILASASPRRREILETIGIEHTVMVSNYDESLTPVGLSPEELVLVNSIEKGKEVAGRINEEAIVISSDTVVAMPGEKGYVIFGKPKDREDAIAMLHKLSGRSHVVFTGLAVIDTETGRCESCVDSTEVQFATLTQEEIEWYVDTLEPMDKAGSYAVQGLGARFITGINGSYHTVMGLPSHLVYRLLMTSGCCYF